jgi:hypothetical protein
MDNGILIALAVLAVYLCVAIWLVVFSRRRSRGNSSFLLRIGIPSSVAAFLFAPTFGACGGASPVPFPFLVVIDVAKLFLPAKEGSCGYQTPFNSIIVLATLVAIALVCLLIEWARFAIRRKTSNQSFKGDVAKATHP